METLKDIGVVLAILGLGVMAGAVGIIYYIGHKMFKNL